MLAKIPGNAIAAPSAVNLSEHVRKRPLKASILVTDDSSTLGIEPMQGQVLLELVSVNPPAFPWIFVKAGEQFLV